MVGLVLGGCGRTEEKRVGWGQIKGGQESPCRDISECVMTGPRRLAQLPAKPQWFYTTGLYHLSIRTHGVPPHFAVGFDIVAHQLAVCTELAVSNTQQPIPNKPVYSFQGVEGWGREASLSALTLRRGPAGEFATVGVSCRPAAAAAAGEAGCGAWAMLGGGAGGRDVTCSEGEDGVRFRGSCFCRAEKNR